MATTDEKQRDNLPPVDPTKGGNMAKAAFALGAASIVANGLTTAGFMPVIGMQIAGFVAATCTALSWYLARRSPAPTQKE